MRLELSHHHLLQNFRAQGEIGYSPIIYQDEMRDYFKQYFSYCNFEIQEHTILLKKKNSHSILFWNPTGIPLSFPTFYSQYRDYARLRMSVLLSTLTDEMETHFSTLRPPTLNSIAASRNKHVGASRLAICLLIYC